MTSALTHWVFIFSLVLALTALGTMIVMPEVFAKSGGNDKNNKKNKAPTANAGPDQSVNEGAPAALNGAGSSDSDGDTLTYSWNQISGSTVVLNNKNTAKPAFTAPQVGHSGAALTFQLTVSDGHGGTSVDTVSITVKNLNKPPVANAGRDKTANEGQIVILSGIASDDPDGNSLTYSWTRTSGPAVSVLGANSPLLFFVAPHVNSAGAVITFSLTVNDGKGGISSDSVAITIQNNNRSPVANAGADQTVNEGTIVTMNGTASTDPDGNSLAYSWIQTNGTSVTLTGSNTAMPSFTAPNVGSAGTTLVFQLMVNDGNGGANSDTVNISVNNVNVSPTANAGPDQTINEGQFVSLNGAASSDPDLDIVTYSWNQINGPTVTLSGETTSMPFFTAPQVSVDTTFTFSLSVNDGKGGNSSDSVSINVQNIYLPPIVNAGADQTASEGSLVTLDGSASSSDEGSLAYTWTQTAGPLVTLNNTNAVQPTFIAPEKNPIMSTLLTFQLSVSDGITSQNDTMTVMINDKYFVAQGLGGEGTGYYSVNENSGQRLGHFSLATWFKTSVNYSAYPAKSLIANKGGFGSESAGKNMNYGIWIDCGLACGSISNANKIQAGFEIKSNGTDKFIESINTYNDGKWHYVVLTFDGAAMDLYIDGALEGTLATTATPDAANTAPLRLGANSLDVTTPLAARYFTGYIDDVRVWSFAITALEVSNQFNLGDYNTSATVIAHLDLNS